jgi:hypothetical protein
MQVPFHPPQLALELTWHRTSAHTVPYFTAEKAKKFYEE